MNDTERYNDIIGLSRPQSKKHPPMSEVDRAAQFSPFAALKGYEEEIEEAARFTDGRLEPDEERMNAVNATLLLLKEKERLAPTVSITFFRPDERKEGGAFVTLTDKIKKIDVHRRVLYTQEHAVPFDDIEEIEITQF